MGFGSIGALRNVKHERFALLIASHISPQPAAKEAGIDMVYAGNVARIARRKDARRRIDELSGAFDSDSSDTYGDDGGRTSQRHAPDRRSAWTAYDGRGD